MEQFADALIKTSFCNNKRGPTGWKSTILEKKESENAFWDY